MPPWSVICELVLRRSMWSGHTCSDCSAAWARQGVRPTCSCLSSSSSSCLASKTWVNFFYKCEMQTKVRFHSQRSFVFFGHRVLMAWFRIPIPFMLCWLSFLPVRCLFPSSLNGWWLRPTANVVPLSWDGEFSPSCTHRSLLGDQDEKQDCPLWHLSQTETTSSRTCSSLSSLLNYKTTLLWWQPFAKRQTS